MKRLAPQVFRFSLAAAGACVVILTSVMLWNTRIAQKPSLWPGGAWHDDRFALEKADASTFIIGEPRYWQVNFSYLLLGNERALLIDTGPGVRDLRPLIQSLTTLPVTVILTHCHYDHTGNAGKFESLMMPDIPELKKRLDAQGMFRPSPILNLALTPPRFRVCSWIKPGTTIDLGGRVLRIEQAPGHSPESIIIIDEARRMVFTGDFIYPGHLLAMLPGSNLAAYRQSCTAIMKLVPSNATLMCGHTAPRLPASSIADLCTGLESIEHGKLSFKRYFLIMKKYQISKGMFIITW